MRPSGHSRCCRVLEAFDETLSSSLAYPGKHLLRRLSHLLTSQVYVMSSRFLVPAVPECSLCISSVGGTPWHCLTPGIDVRVWPIPSTVHAPLHYQAATASALIPLQLPLTASQLPLSAAETCNGRPTTQVGTIFGVWPGDKLKGITGRDQAAAGMGVFGPRTCFVIALKDAPGCHEFLLQDDGARIGRVSRSEVSGRCARLRHFWCRKTALGQQAAGLRCSSHSRPGGVAVLGTTAWSGAAAEGRSKPSQVPAAG